jgi:hypothetical protein
MTTVRVSIATRTPALTSGAKQDAMFIYRILNVCSGRCYVGQARSQKHLRLRWRVHRRSLADGTHHNVPLQRAWHKYGPGAFRFEVIATANSAAELDMLEACCVAANTEGYNTRGGGGAPTYGPEIRAKIGARVREALRRPEVRAKLGSGARGRPSWNKGTKGRVRGPVGVQRSDDYRARLSATWRAKYEGGHAHPQLGAKHDVDRRQRNSASNSKVEWDGFVRPDGTPEPPFRNLTQFAKDRGLCVQGFHNLSTGRARSYRGWTYRSAA